MHQKTYHISKMYLTLKIGDVNGAMNKKMIVETRLQSFSTHA